MTVTIDTNRQTSKIGSWSFDFNKKLFFATNDTYLIFGRSQDAFDGSLQNVLEFIVEEDRDAFVKGMEAAYGGTPLNLMFRFSLQMVHLSIFTPVQRCFIMRMNRLTS